MTTPLSHLSQRHIQVDADQHVFAFQVDLLGEALDIELGQVGGRRMKESLPTDGAIQETASRGDKHAAARYRTVMDCSKVKRPSNINDGRARIQIEAFLMVEANKLTYIVSTGARQV